MKFSLKNLVGVTSSFSSCFRNFIPPPALEIIEGVQAFCNPGKKWGRASGLQLNMLAEERLIMEASSSSPRKVTSPVRDQVSVSDFHHNPQSHPAQCWSLHSVPLVVLLEVGPGSIQLTIGWLL